MAWTDERIALLKQYWEEGRSASQIAEILGEGLSRNAVIGKAHRLGLASRPSPLKTGEAKAESKAPKAEAKPAAPKPAPRPAPQPVAAAPAPQPAPTPVVAAPVAPPVAPAPAALSPGLQPAPRPAAPRGKGERVTLLDLNDRICKWPIGHPDEPDFHFCGKPVNPGFPYCGEHCLVAYQAQMPRRDRPGGPPRPFGPNLPRPR
ncbi:GcrA cell cycle regulator [Sandaracinobacter neustonicus]|uniref:GcrA cell cycle regulator n=1 Tax=Sandaracinobacter neustonicus TaxID=1715348 RepID=A0A501XMZ0_9SPHN|nr:GcrA family cell cycle regulator [Sandaracinobacter neustonicus]TPE61805.1 GcrA cell cycle regulator [Sandaracinobacter neustonicus]